MSTTYSRWTQSGLESFAVTGPSATRDLFVRMGQHQRAIADIHRLRPKPRDAATGWQTRRFEDIHSNRIQVLYALGIELAWLLPRFLGIANRKKILDVLNFSALVANQTFYISYTRIAESGLVGQAIVASWTQC